MRSNMHTITPHQAYIEKLSLWIINKQKDLETHIDHAPACVHFVRIQEGARSLHISIKNHDTQTEKGKFIYKALTLPGKQLLLKCDGL